MHPYSIDTNERIKVLVVIFITSMLLYQFIHYLCSFLPDNINSSNLLTSAIGALSATAIFWSLFYLFDNYAWKWKIFRKDYYITEPLVQIPKLQGIWEGEYVSFRFCEETKEEIEEEGFVELKIEQTWTKIRIVQSNKKSTSSSEVAGIFLNGKTGTVLRYQYTNEPNATGNKTMHIHEGFNKLIFHPEKQELRGDYFNDKNRKSYGHLVCRKKVIKN